MAARAGRKSVVGHLLARADFLPCSQLSPRASLRASTRPRSTLKAGNLSLLAFVLSARALVSYLPARASRICGARSSGRRSRGSGWSVTRAVPRTWKSAVFKQARARWLTWPLLTALPLPLLAGPRSPAPRRRRIEVSDPSRRRCHAACRWTRTSTSLAYPEIRRIQTNDSATGRARADLRRRHVH